MAEKHIVSLKIPLKPVSKGRPRLGKQGNIHTPQKTVFFEESVKSIVRYRLNQLDSNKRFLGPFLGAFKVSLKFVYKGKKSQLGEIRILRPDIDNLIKSVCDALNGIIWHDDSQICHIEAVKIYGAEDHILLDVWSLF